MVYALGTINFLFDKSTEPYVTASDLVTAFKVNSSTVKNKAKQIRELIKSILPAS